jgi:cytochrome c oxidase subunit IV
MVGRDATAHGGHGPGPAMPGTKPGTDHLVGDDSGHPSPSVYIRVAILLSIITAVEVAIYYIEGIRDVLVPILIVLSIAKFVAVVGYFMHLRFDDRRFRWLFIAGLVISTSVVLALVAMFWTDTYFFLPVGEGAAE